MNIRTTAIALAMSSIFAVSGQAALVTQLLGTGSRITLDQALMIAGVNLEQDTTLSQAQIDSFSTIGENDFVGCYAAPSQDPTTGIGIGNVVECLRVVPAADGAQLNALVFHVFSGVDGGTIVTLGLTSVRPFFEGVGDANGASTHVTGSIPADDSGIVGGAGAFAGATGSARVSGAVNLSSFPEALTFDCLWQLGVPAEQPPLPSAGDTSQKLDQIQEVVNRIARSLSLVVED